MTELQQARQQYLDELSENVRLRAQVVELREHVAHLNERLMKQAIAHYTDCLSAPWVALAAEIRSKS